ncbi:MAG TPA: polysaccharide biosynthesis/export family protein [Asticcacaulis sp.]|nr:polysaccharide biosynthesis/export family protein [Asticcacaulis sp.]
MSGKLFGFLLFAGLTAALPAVSQTQPTAPQTSAPVMAPADPVAAPAQAAPTASSLSKPASEAGGAAPLYQYTLGSGDQIRVIIFGEPDLSGEKFFVSGEGKVSLPLIGEVSAIGLTATQLQDKIATAFLNGGYLKNPRVNVEILTFRPFYILGEVSRPGEYPFSNGMTLERAVATASGYTYRADHKKVFIKHANDEKEVAVPLTSQVMIAPGDTVRVPERYF